MSRKEINRPILSHMYLNQHISKKALATLFLVALIQFGSAWPMMFKLICCWGKTRDNPHQALAETTFKDLPYDCLYNVLTFFENPSKLRVISKDFDTVFNEHPCFSVCIHDKPKLLYYRFSVDALGFMCVKLRNEVVIDKFLNDLPLFVSDYNWSGAVRRLSIYMKLDEKSYVTFLDSRLERLLRFLRSRNGILRFLKIYYHDDIGDSIKKFVERLKYKWYDGSTLTWVKFYYKDNITNEELALFGDFQNIHFHRCTNFRGSNMAWPEGLKLLEIYECQNFDFGNLKDFTELQTFYLKDMDEFSDDALNDVPESLTTLKISSCKNFTGEGLKRAGSLKTLWVRGGKNFSVNFLAGLQLSNLSLYGYKEGDFPEEMLKKIRKNNCKVEFKD